MSLPTLFFCAACAASGPSAAPAPTAPPTAQAAASSGIDPRDTRMLSEPAAGARHVAFVYASDIWVAGANGGPARRLTAHAGRESRPRIPPDGAWIAFSGEYDGNTDVYLVPVEGGEPRRLTWHPGADGVVGFTPDGREVLFTSQREVYTNRFAHLFRVGLDGGVAARLPLPTCFDAAMSPDGKKIAYCPLADASTQWKNYRGGTARGSGSTTSPTGRSSRSRSRRSAATTPTRCGSRARCTSAPTARASSTSSRTTRLRRRSSSARATPTSP
jgi:Tol biopolymer transport system component